MSSSASKIQETTPVAPPVVPTIVDHTPYCNIKKIACFAVAFFVLSGAGVGLLIHFRLTQFLPACYAVGGLSFIIIAIGACKLCCETQSKAWDPNRLSEAGPIEENTKTETQELPALTQWKERPLMKPIKGIRFTVADVIRQESQYLLINCVQEEAHHPLNLSAADITNLKTRAGNLGSIATSCIQAYNVCPKDAIPMLKTTLWNLCFDENGALKPAGHSLRETGNNTLMIYCGTQNMSCKFMASAGNIRLTTQGPLAIIMTELRSQLEAVHQASLTQN